MMSDSNQGTYRRRTVVRYYQQLKKLQPAEQTIFDYLRPQFPQMTMLDVGVGGGRTTQHLAHEMLNYTGIDYSTEMIEVCRKRFLAQSETVRFDVCDARDLSQFESQSFDFVLFSYNGLDSISHGERLQFFAEIQRIGKPGGYFCFSSHNLQGMDLEFALKTKLSSNPFRTYENIVMWLILRFFNRHLTGPQLASSAHAVIRDESHNFRLKQYYIRPETQLKQLTQWFGDVTVYSWQTGQAIAKSDLSTQDDMWLYYLCKMT